MRLRHTSVLSPVLALLLPSGAFAQTGTTLAAPDVTVPDSYLVFSATAHAVPAGHGYFQMSQVLFPRFQVGVTDTISVGAATFALAPRVVLLTPKVQLLRGESWSVAVGMMHLAGIPQVQTGVAYAVGTLDVGRVSISTGIGMAYANYQDAQDAGHRGRAAVGTRGAQRRD